MVWRGAAHSLPPATSGVAVIEESWSFPPCLIKRAERGVYVFCYCVTSYGGLS